MKKIILAVALTFGLAGAASATSFGAGLQISGGYGQAASSSSTVGGSQFSVGVNSNGSSHGYAESTGGGTAEAGVKFTANDVKTSTNNTSYATGDAKSHINGSATGTGSAAQGTDTASAAAGQFGKIGVFGNLGVSFGH